MREPFCQCIGCKPGYDSVDGVPWCESRPERQTRVGSCARSSKDRLMMVGSARGRRQWCVAAVIVACCA